MLESLTQSAAAVTLVEAKAHMRVTYADDNTLITSQILMAQQLVESQTRLTLSSAQWQVTTQDREIALEWGDLATVDEVATIAKDGTATVITDFTQPNYNGARYVYIGDATEGPTFRVKYTTQANADKIQLLKQAVLMTVGHFYENREQIVMGAKPEEMPLGAVHIMRHLSIGRYA